MKEEIQERTKIDKLLDEVGFFDNEERLEKTLDRIHEWIRSADGSVQIFV